MSADRSPKFASLNDAERDRLAELARESAALREVLKTWIEQFDRWQAGTLKVSVTDEFIAQCRVLLSSPSPGAGWRSPEEVRGLCLKAMYAAWPYGFVRGRAYEALDTLEAMCRVGEFEPDKAVLSVRLDALLAKST